MKSIYGILFAVLSSIALMPQPVAAAARSGKLNFVFVLMDDMGWTDAGCLGSKFYETSGIDRLAKSGMRFTNGYAACPVCSPTRASIMTGKYPARLHITDWFTGTKKGRLLPAEYRNNLPLDEVTLAEVLRAAGYATGFIGKWHLGGAGYEPTKQGFDSNIAGDQRGSPPSYFSPYKNPNLADGPKGEYLTDRLTSEAFKFIETNKDRPFFLYLSHYSVHIPLQAKKELVDKYKAKADRLPKSAQPRFVAEHDKECRQVHDHPVYAAMVEGLDTNIGRLLDKLKELGLEENTVVIFTSDNGGLSTSEGLPTANVPLRGGKGWLYEGGVRVPWLICWPGIARAGSVCDVPVISTDFYPTILEMAGLPANPKQHMDGVSIVPLLKGDALPERALFWHYPHYSNQGGRPSGSIRVGDLVLIENFEAGSLELYDLKKDVGEKQNLAETMPQPRDRMHALLRDWRRSVAANMPRVNPDWGK